MLNNVGILINDSDNHKIAISIDLFSTIVIFTLAIKTYASRDRRSFFRCNDTTKEYGEGMLLSVFH